MNQTDKTLAKLFAAPPIEWPRMADKLNSSDMLTVSRMAENDAERLAFIGEYLSARANGRDSGDAVKQARSKVAKVRRAMGYSYPNHGLARLSI